MADEQATCRACGVVLRGKPYCYGGIAFNIMTGEQAKVNHYGGYVCSRECDFRASLALERSMPGHGSEQADVGVYARRSIEANWGAK